MSEQITYYHDARKWSSFCYRVEIALLEAGASYTAHGFDIYDKPAWFAQVNPLTGKVVPAITYGGPTVPPEAPSPLSFKLTESLVILEFLADVFPDATLLPPVSDPIRRARVRLFIDVASRFVERPLLELLFDPSKDVPGALETLVGGLEKIQNLLPDPHAADGGEFAIGKHFTNADCAIVPLLTIVELIVRAGLGRAEPETVEKLIGTLAADKFARLRRYQEALWERESVKVIDFDRLLDFWKAKHARN